ncbi:Uncharacterised protein [Anaerotruncus sp. 2789STDY5834896]|uniref:DUF4160 domain-containing protein n=1 Tax=uncultured Anaerotruncus sp. TaxID=905011 RepID=A0A1C6I8G1_9FIRM|nr:Uncharacterised protein [uncultured Anaerotruncus sp.]
MPEVSNFYGIRICFYYLDHNPPHFHAEYGDYTALVDINEGAVIRGQLPGKQLKLVLAWCEIHREELLQNWERAKGGSPVQPINPLI